LGESGQVRYFDIFHGSNKRSPVRREDGDRGWNVERGSFVETGMWEEAEGDVLANHIFKNSPHPQWPPYARSSYACLFISVSLPPHHSPRNHIE